MFSDFILNGSGVGPVGEVLEGSRFDTGLLRPFFETNPESPRYGKKCVTVNSGRKVWDEATQTYRPKLVKMTLNEARDLEIDSPVFNATTLRKEEWIKLDDVILRAARLRLRAWADLAGANSYSLDGMSTPILEHETMSDPGEAIVDMDGLSEGRTDNPLFQLQGIPLPITHSDFWFSKRRLMVSRNRGTPLDLTMGEAAGRRVAETIEQTLIGTTTGVTYGGGSLTPQYGRASTVFGYTNFTNRVTFTSIVQPTGTNGDAVMGSWLALRETMYSQRFFGPFMVYTSTDWDQYLDRIYSSTNPAAGTLRRMLLQIDGIAGIRRLDYLTNATNPFTVIFVQMTPDVARAINGMDITTVQWESLGGMRLNFKVMAIQCPQLRADFNGRSGIGHGTTS
jgi:hypothetical protein